MWTYVGLYKTLSELGVSEVYSQTSTYQQLLGHGGVTYPESYLSPAIMARPPWIIFWCYVNETLHLIPQL